MVYLIMVLTNDFWKVLGAFSNAATHEREMSKIVLEQPEYISSYASAKRQLIATQADLNEVIGTLKLEGLFTEDMEAALNPKPLDTIYPDRNMIAVFWDTSPGEERMKLLLRLSIMKGLAENYVEMNYEVLPQGFRDKMEGIHNE